ncbi:MAG: PfkB family carbohydrate kinase, partial [Bdellovibrio sp.]
MQKFTLADRDRLLQFAQREQTQEILVIGDAGLDEYITGEVHRISPEAPVPVLEATHQMERVGLAGNVAQNITALGARAHFVSVIGEDAAGDSLLRNLETARVDTHSVFRDSSRPTIRKTRAMAGPHHLLRIDHEIKASFSPAIQNKIIQRVEELLPRMQAVVIEDYAKGLLSRELTEALMHVCRSQNKPVYVDPARLHPPSQYRSCQIFKPNADEALQMARVPRSPQADIQELLQEAARILYRETEAEHILITQGKKGMSLFQKGQLKATVPTVARQVYDVTGAGDTVIASLAVGLTGGLSLLDACVFANFAAGYVVGQV